MIEDVGTWAWILLGATPFVAAGAVEMFKPIMQKKFVMFVGGFVGAVFAGLAMMLITTDAILVAVMAILGLFAPKVIADQILERLGINRSAK